MKIDLSPPYKEMNSASQLAAIAISHHKDMAALRSRYAAEIRNEVERQEAQGINLKGPEWEKVKASFLLEAISQEERASYHTLCAEQMSEPI